MDWTKMQLIAETPALFFQKEVQAAMKRQQVQAGEYTEYYLVNLLCTFVRPLARYEDRPDDPLALRLARALEADAVQQRMRLRRLGDLTLFTTGFFSDSLARRAVDVDYYVSMGQFAYQRLTKWPDGALAPVFADLAGKFVAYMDVLAEIRERATVALPNPATETLRQYEKWLRTGSNRDAQLLIKQGIVPNAAIGKRFLQ